MMKDRYISYLAMAFIPTMVVACTHKSNAPTPTTNPADTTNNGGGNEQTEDKAEDRMPQAPLPALTGAQIALIRRWINEGAQNHGDCGTLCDSNNISYANGIKTITEKYCRGCHNSVSPSGGVSLDTYDGIRVVALDGRLVNVVNHNPGFVQMPKGGSKLSACQIRQIEKWVAAGAQNN